MSFTLLFLKQLFLISFINKLFIDLFIYLVNDMLLAYHYNILKNSIIYIYKDNKFISSFNIS